MLAEENASRSMAMENAARSRGDSEAWFRHDTSSSAQSLRQVPRIRPEAADIVARNRQAAGSMGEMAGFSGLGSAMSSSAAGRRRGTEEASRNAERMTGASGRWIDFENNSQPGGGGVTPRAPRVGASDEAREIMKAQTRPSDWMSQSMIIPDSSSSIRRNRPASSQVRSSAYDWFSHSDRAEAGTRRSLRRVRAEGIEYAQRNQGREDLLKTVNQEYSTLPLYRCPTADSQMHCRHNKESTAVLECMRTVPSNHDGASNERVTTGKKHQAPQSAATKREGGVAECLTIPPNSDSKPVKQEPSRMARCLGQMDKDAPPSPVRYVRSISDEAKVAQQKNRLGQMGELIGKGAESAIYSHPSKMQMKAVKSDEARRNQAKSRGSATRDLITHTNLSPIPTKKPIHSPEDHVGKVLGGPGDNKNQGEEWRPVRRLVSAEAKHYADRQGGVRDLLSFG